MQSIIIFKTYYDVIRKKYVQIELFSHYILFCPCAIQRISIVECTNIYNKNNQSQYPACSFSIECLRACTHKVIHIIV